MTSSQTIRYEASIDKNLVAAAGKYHCLAQLLIRDYPATATLSATSAKEIRVPGPEGATVATVMVKTRTRSEDQGWMMNQKHEKIVRPDLFYAFVNLKEPRLPQTYVIPSRVVATVLRLSHEAWLKEPGSRGQAHTDTDMRRMRPSYRPSGGIRDGWMDKYLENWEQIPHP